MIRLKKKTAEAAAAKEAEDAMMADTSAKPDAGNGKARARRRRSAPALPKPDRAARR